MNYAGFWRRFLARVIDALLLLIPTVLLSIVIPYVGGALLALLYWPLFDASSVQGTPGKIFMGLVVTDESGERIHLKRAFARYLLSFVSGLMLCIGYLFYFFTPKKQTFHDVFAGTLVLYRPLDGDVDWGGIWLTQARAAWRESRDFFEAGGKSPAESAPSPVKDLEQLHELFQKGIISEDEFRKKKEEILSRM